MVAALFLYTCESRFYVELNRVMRMADRHAAKAFFPCLKLLLTAIERLAPVKAVVWRGILQLAP